MVIKACPREGRQQKCPTYHIQPNCRSTTARDQRCHSPSATRPKRRLSAAGPHGSRSHLHIPVPSHAIGQLSPQRCGATWGGGAQRLISILPASWPEGEAADSFVRLRRGAASRRDWRSASSLRRFEGRTSAWVSAVRSGGCCAGAVAGARCQVMPPACLGPSPPLPPRTSLPRSGTSLPFCGAARDRQPDPGPSCPRGAEAAGVGARTARPRLPRHEAAGRAAGGSGDGAFVISVLNEAGGARPSRGAAGKGLKGSVWPGSAPARGALRAALSAVREPGSARGPAAPFPALGSASVPCGSPGGRTTQRELCWTCALQIPAPCFSYRAPEGETREQDEQNRRRKGLPLNNMPPELLHGDKGIRYVAIGLIWV